MNMKELASKVAKKEGKKDNDSLANVREIISIVSDLMYADNEVVMLLLANGKRRARGKK